jgi:hypothetical protein
MTNIKLTHFCLTSLAKYRGFRFSRQTRICKLLLCLHVLNIFVLWMYKVMNLYVLGFSRFVVHVSCSFQGEKKYF